MANHNQEQSTTNLSVFNFKDQEVRVVSVGGNPHWILADICKVLEIEQPVRVAERLKQDGVNKTHVIDSLGRDQEVLCINEPNLYRTIFRSNKSEAIVFQDWIFEEVIPSIRKTGSYSMDNRSPKEQLQDQLGMLQFVHKIVRGVFRALSQRWIVENKQLALYGKVAFDYFRLEVMRANKDYSSVVKYFHGDNVFDGLNLKGDIVKMQSEIKNGEISVQLQFPFLEDAR